MSAKQRLLAVLWLCVAVCTVAQAGRPFAPDDFFRVHEVTDPRVSPDGLWVAYIVSSNEREGDEAQTVLWMTSWDGTQHIQLTNPPEGAEKPRWSPDGRYLAFLSTPSGADAGQIKLLDRRGGEARTLTNVKGDIRELAWSPDGKRLVLSMDQGELDGPNKPIVIESWHFKQDEDGYLRAGQRRHLYVLDVGSQRLDPLTSDPGYNEDLPVWSPDAREIAFVRTKDAGGDRDGRADIDIMEARPGATPRTIVRPYAPNAQRLDWTPDGARLTYLAGLEPRLNAYIQDRLFVIPAAGGTARSLTDKLDRAVMSYALQSDSTVTIAVEDDCTIYPASLDLASGELQRAVAPGPFTVSAITAGGGHTALLLSNDHALNEVYALENSQLRKLTAHNEALLAELSLGAVEQLRFNSKDGTDIHALLTKPPLPEAGRKYPLLLWIHGGPNGQDEHELAFDGYQFEPPMFAARGFLVLRVNYRGGSGRGAAFARAILADWGHKEVEDLLAGVNYLIARGVADPARMAVGGWSYGGILTDYTIASDTRFKAAISGAGSANQISMFGVDEYILQYDAELGPPWKDTSRWLKVSYPFFHADRIHTPTLFLGGSKDFNVPIAGGEQMYEALRTLGVPTQLVIYPDQHHIISRPSFLKDLGERVSNWLGRYVQ